MPTARLWCLLRASILLTFAGAPLGLPVLARAERPAVPGELIVKLRPGVERQRGRALAREQGGEVVGEVGALRLQRIRLPESVRARARQALRLRGEVEWAAANELFRPSALPDDPSYGVAWHLARLGAPAAWELSQGEGVTIAILDSGVDAAHPDLAGKLVPGWDFYEGDANTADGHGHGTRVAGAAAAATDNALGVAAVGWQARILPLRVAGQNGAASAWAITQALAYAADHGARVMNLSFANVGDSQAVVDAAAYAVAQGGVVVVGAGNCGCTAKTPARAELLTVGATNENDALGDFSSRGAHLDLAAPGVRIWTTDRDGAYGKYTGTSYSTPVVSGLVALMLAANPALDAAGVAELLQATAVDLGDPGWDPGFGAGRVDAAAAVRAAADAAGPDSTPPDVAIASPADGVTIGTRVEIEVEAADDRALAGLEVFADGVSLGTQACSGRTCSGVFEWNALRAQGGWHELSARALDAAGNAGEAGISVLRDRSGGGRGGRR
jgi:subtilisin family serine protease